MPFTRPLSMLTCITLISFAATSFAAPSGNKDQAERKAEILKKFDKDGDGKLSDAEKKTLRTEMLKKFDKDGDGKLSYAEKKTLRAEMQSRQGGKDRRQWSPEQRAEMLRKLKKMLTGN